MSVKKCKLCGRSFIDKSHLIKHIDKAHSSQIPDGWTSARYENYIRTGKTHGNCVVCKEETPWNESTEKYCRMCGKESCRKTARELAEKNLIKKRGVTHSQMLNDPDFQRKMVYSKKNSGAYVFSDDDASVKVYYDSSFGKDFLEMLEFFMNWSSCDIMGPSPNTYVYLYEGKQHFYIPDYYIPSLHLEVEIKDGGSNPNKHPKIQSVDKVKEALKDEAMKNAKVNYVKISNKDYSTFFKMLFVLKEKDADKQGDSQRSEFSYIIESTTPENWVDSEQSIIQWFYLQFKSIRNDGDIISLYSKIEATINQIKKIVNQDDIDDKKSKVLLDTIGDLENIKEELDKKMTDYSK